MLGDYIPAKLGMDSGENPVFMAVTTDYQGYLLFAFENGKAAKVPLSAYATKTRRRKLANAYSDKARLVQALQLCRGLRGALHLQRYPDAHCPLRS